MSTETTTTELREGILLGFGNPLLDITANVDEKFLAKYGMEPDNAILAEDKHTPMYEELTRMPGVQYTAGGSVQNSLRVAQWLLAKPNCAVSFGAVGIDEYSAILAAKARHSGVNVQYQHHDYEPTGTCGVLLTGHHRSLCANLAAANCFTIEHIETPANRRIIERGEFFYVSGYFLTVSPPTIQAIARHALAHDRPFMMNLSAPFLSQFFKQPLMAAMPFVDILFGNATEASVFASEQNFDGALTLPAIALRIAALPKRNEERARIVIVTRGSEPVLMAHGGRVVEVPVERLDDDCVVDTNGAGDAFVGGFLAQLVRKRSYVECIRCGIWAARQIIQRSGCTFEGRAEYVGGEEEEEETDDTRLVDC